MRFDHVRDCYSKQAEKDLERLRRNEPGAHKKAVALLLELMTHPKTGTGHPEQLKGARSGQWSRAITKKHRLIYKIHDNEVYVDILSSYGHYDDK